MFQASARSGRMCKTFVVILLAFAKQGLAEHPADKLFDRALQVPLEQRQLDITALGKPGHLEVARFAGPARLPALHGGLQVAPRAFASPLPGPSASLGRQAPRAAAEP